MIDCRNLPVKRVVSSDPLMQTLVVEIRLKALQDIPARFNPHEIDLIVENVRRMAFEKLYGEFVDPVRRLIDLCDFQLDPQLVNNAEYRELRETLLRLVDFKLHAVKEYNSVASPTTTNP